MLTIMYKNDILPNFYFVGTQGDRGRYATARFVGPSTRLAEAAWPEEVVRS